jgi:hypothetical protein
MESQKKLRFIFFMKTNWKSLKKLSSILHLIRQPTLLLLFVKMIDKNTNFYWNLDQ